MEEPSTALSSRQFHTRDSNSHLRHQKRDTTTIVQRNARLELAMISQPPRVDFSRPLRDDLVELPGFVYNSTAGKGITVFIIDIGINQDNSVSTLSNSPRG
jgi:hypothetical protein